jgi:flagellar FliL protein
MPEDDKKQTGAEGAAAPAPVPSGGGFISWLPLLVSFLLMPALAYGVAQFVILPQLQKGLGISGSGTTVPAKKEATASKSANAKQESVVMNKLLVNVADTMGARYLLVSLSVVGNASDFKDKMTEHDAQLRDMACGALSTKTLADLEKPDARNLIRTELMTGFNNILGDSMVQDIYFTEFAIQ